MLALLATAFDLVVLVFVAMFATGDAETPDAPTEPAERQVIERLVR